MEVERTNCSRLESLPTGDALLKHSVIYQDDYVVLSIYQVEAEYFRLRENWVRAQYEGDAFDRDALGFGGGRRPGPDGPGGRAIAPSRAGGTAGYTDDGSPVSPRPGGLPAIA